MGLNAGAPKWLHRPITNSNYAFMVEVIANREKSIFHQSYFEHATGFAFTRSGYFNGTTNSFSQWSVMSESARPLPAGTDFNNVVGIEYEGTWQVTFNATNAPASGWGVLEYHRGNADTTGYQVFTTYLGNRYLRTRNNGIWGTWQQFVVNGSSPIFGNLTVSGTATMDNATISGVTNTDGWDSTLITLASGVKSTYGVFLNSRSGMVEIKLDGLYGVTDAIKSSFATIPKQYAPSHKHDEFEYTPFGTGWARIRVNSDGNIGLEMLGNATFTSADFMLTSFSYMV